ncbi:class I SAM-dependent methyltransferase [Tessaracoccus sp. MC1756]|uniref:class I SAM-dependent methyltransferase n=1 Tax=Tessaracoccus sp. MC1756 TaxID=2760311 RepID=UPI0015FF74A3|nr:class I SAM-dependent methyltransferase [Tessaracoccus sp. MC1756]MBB1509765.1 class I SAM-dependent methyltransferase [Tessaracoccus sp. MC1756]
MTTPEDRQRRLWDTTAARYDQMVAPLEGRFMAASRRWVGERAVGETLEVAIGTGLNLPHYPDAVAVTGLDISAPMLDEARARAARTGREVTLVEGDAQDLPFADGTFDTVVSTFAMCGVGDDDRALAELVRVVRPNGRILLADHVVSTNPVLHALQLALEAVTKRTNGEYWTRRPLPKLERMSGVEIVDSGRSHVGMIEHLHARRS